MTKKKKKMSYLTTLSLARFFERKFSTIPEKEVDPNKRVALDEWHQSDFLYRNYILNGLDNVLYNVYCHVKIAKELMEILEKKCRTEDDGLKKFVVGRFLDFKTVESKILHEINAKGMSPSESFQVAALIEKLPPL